MDSCLNLGDRMGFTKPRNVDPMANDACGAMSGDGINGRAFIATFNYQPIS